MARSTHARMRPIELKISELAVVTEYSRFQVDGLLKQVFANSLGKKAGSQRTFSPQDLLVAAVACEIEQKYGVERKKLALVGDALRQTLTGPRRANREARLLVTFSPPVATYLVPDAAVAEGLVVKLSGLFAKVDEFLGVSGPSRESAQAILPLKPAIVNVNVTARRGSGSRSR